jgi:hypothetical protein
VGGSATDCSSNPCDPGCHVFSDTPDAAYRSPVADAGVTVSNGGSLAASNIPQGFKNKGLDKSGVCTPGCTSQACQQACQYDQQCSPTQNATCEAFAPGQTGACTGVDITVGVACSTADGSQQTVFVCNRGTEDAPPGIPCWQFQGNSQHMPTANQDTTGASLIAITLGTVKPGACEAVLVPNSMPPLTSNGATEVLCNLPGTRDIAFAGGPRFPSSSAAGPASEASWSTPTGAHAVNAPYATAALVDGSGTTTGPLFPTANGTVGSDAAWTSPEKGQAQDLAYAIAVPGMPAAITGTTAATPTSDTGSLGSAAYTSDGAFGSMAVAKNATVAVDFAGFDETALPSNATLTSVDIRVVWKADVASHKMETEVEAFVGATSVSSQLAATFSGNTPTTAYTQEMLGLTSISAANLRDAGFKVRVTFINGNNGNTAITASVDYVLVTAHWSNAATTVSAVYQSFGFGGWVPATATVTALIVEAKWKASVVTADAQLAFGAYSGGSLVAGSDFTETSPATAATVRSTTVNNPAGLTGAGLADGTFKVVVGASRLLNAGLSTPFTAYLDYVKATVKWTAAAGTGTHGLLYGGFGFAIPANATITKITTEASWKLSASTASTFGLQAFNSGAALGTEATDVTRPTQFATVTQVLTGAALGSTTPADLNGGAFQVHARVSR